MTNLHGRRIMTEADLDRVGLSDVLVLLRQHAGSARAWGGQQVDISVYIVEGRDGGDVGAWAHRPDPSKPNRYDVWLTDVYARFLTRHSMESAAHLLRVVRQLGPQDHLVKLWGELPCTEEASELFARLVATATSTFIVQHEIAHVLLGHLTSRPPNFGALLGTEDSRDRFESPTASAMIDETEATSAFSALDATTSEALWSQMREVDADTHGLFWTWHLMRELGTKTFAGSLGDDLRNAIFETFLRSDAGVAYVTTLGAVFALILLGSSRLQRPLVRGSHPPLAARVVMVTLAASRMFASDHQGLHQNAQSFATSLLATIVARSWAKDGVLPPLNETFDAGARQTYVYKAVLEQIGIIDAMAMLPALTRHYAKLGMVRRAVSPHLARYATVNAEAMLPWFGDASR